MYKKSLQGIRQYEVEPKSVLLVQYYVIEKQLNPYESYYGIEIEQKEIKNEMNNTSEYDQIMISEDRSSVEEIINKMIGYGVTTTTMGNIIDDMITVMSC